MRSLTVSSMFTSLAALALVACSAAATGEANDTESTESTESTTEALSNSGGGGGGYCQWGWRDSHSGSGTWNDHNRHCGSDNDCKDGNPKTWDKCMGGGHGGGGGGSCSSNSWHCDQNDSNWYWKDGSCVSYDWCDNDHGHLSNGGCNCQCDSGYDWNSSSHSCEPHHTDSCSNSYHCEHGDSGWYYWHGDHNKCVSYDWCDSSHGHPVNGCGGCECDSGYYWDSHNHSCQPNHGGGGSFNGQCQYSHKSSHQTDTYDANHQSHGCTMGSHDTWYEQCRDHNDDTDEIGCVQTF